MPNSSCRREPLWAAILFLVGLNLLVFGQVVRFEFLIWDDEFFVLPHLKREQGLTARSVLWAFSNRQAGWFTPIPYLSLFADAQLFGLWAPGYHLTNLLLHTINSVLLLVVLRRMTGQLGPSTLAAGLFAVHPLHVEPVVWITTRWELLCGGFWLLGLWAYLGYCRRPGLARYVLVAACFVAALLSKPMALTFPFALLLLDYWPLRRLFPHGVSQPGDGAGDRDPGRSTGRGEPAGDSVRATDLPPVSWRWAVLEKVPLLLIMCVVLYEALRAKTEFFASKSMVRFTVWERTVNAVQTLGTYVMQFVWPTELNFYYPHPVLGDGFDWSRVALCGGLLLLITALVAAARQRFLWVGWLWYLGVFVPALGLVQVEEHARADRYTYLPLIGLIWMVCWSVEWLLGRLPRPAWAWLTAAAIVLLPAALVAQRQASHWRNSETLMRYGAETDPGNFKAWYNLGHLALRAGDAALAEQHFRQAAKAHRTGRAEYLIGRSLMLQGRKLEAVEMLRNSLQRQPDYTVARALLARLLKEQGQAEESARQYQEMLRRRPRDPLANVWYGEYLAGQGEWNGAAEYYRRALGEEDQENEKLVEILGIALEKAGRSAEAAELYREQVRQHPSRWNLADRLAWLLATHPDPGLRDGRQAVRIADELARRSQFRNRFVLDTLAAAHAEQGDYRQAEQTAHQALDLAREAGDGNHAEQLRRRRDLYRLRQPFRDNDRFGPANPANAATPASTATHANARHESPSTRAE